jgi:hypothetical protein
MKNPIQNLILGACLAGGTLTAHAEQVGDVFYIELENHNWTQPNVAGESSLISTTNQAYNLLQLPGNSAFNTTYSNNLSALLGATYDSGTQMITSGLDGDSQIYGSAAAPYINSLLSTNPASNPVLAAGSYVSYASAYHNVLATPTYNSNVPSIHPSAPNYIWQEAGTNFTIANDDQPYSQTNYAGNVGTPSEPIITNQISIHGLSSNNLTGLLQKKYGASGWKSYQEDIDLTPLSGSINNTGSVSSVVAPSNTWVLPQYNFSGSNSSYTNPYNGSHQYNFAAKHDGTLYFPQTSGNGDPTTNNVSLSHYAPLQQLTNDLANNTMAKYNLITPDQYNDQHTALNTSFNHGGITWAKNTDGNQIAVGDNFLSIIIPEIMSSYAFTNTIAPGAIVIWNDEVEGPTTNANTYNTTGTEIVISDLAAGATNGGVFNDTNNLTHSSDLATLQNLYGIPDPLTSTGYLGDASNGTSINGLFVSGAIPSAVPEPSSYVLFGLGALALVIAYRRRKA